MDLLDANDIYLVATNLNEAELRSEARALAVLVYASWPYADPNPTGHRQSFGGCSES